MAGRKQYETRHWPYRFNPGVLAIHAAKKLVKREDLDRLCAEICEDEFGCHWELTLPRGAIIGTGRLVDCAPAHRLRDKVSEEEQALGDWSDGRYVWLLDYRCPLKVPLPWRGMQSFFDVPEDVVRQHRPEPLISPQQEKQKVTQQQSADRAAKE